MIYTFNFPVSEDKNFDLVYVFPDELDSTIVYDYDPSFWEEDSWDEDYDYDPSFWDEDSWDEDFEDRLN
jgi:hypothetical protein